MFRRIVCSTMGSAANSRAGHLTPRTDIDLDAQRRAVAQHNAERLAAFTEEAAVPAKSSASSIVEFKRHALRQLIVEASIRQARRSPPVTPTHGAPAAQTGFNLTQGDNLTALLEDIDTLMSLAASKPEARDKIIDTTVKQVAQLSLWHV